MKEIISMIILGVNGLFQTSKVLGSCVIACPIFGIILLINYLNRKKAKY